MNFTAEILSWIANTLVVISFSLVSRGIIKGDGKIYNFTVLTVTIIYGFYSIVNNIVPLIMTTIAYTIISTRTIYRLYTSPQKNKKHFTLPVSISITLIICIFTIVAIAIKASLLDILTLTGSSIFLSAYFLVASGKIQGDKMIFNSMHLTGATIYGMYAIVENKHPLFVLEIILGSIAISTIYKLLKQKRKRG